MLRLRVLILGTLISLCTWGGSVERYNQVSKIYSSVNCIKNCDLKEFKIQKFDYKVLFDEGTSFGTGMYASYKTQSNQSLEKYGIVQFIRGCHFSSKMNNGKISKLITRSRHYFNEIIPYKHSEWVVDSFDRDPMYASTEENRYWSYRWNRVSGSHDEKTEELFRLASPIESELYVSDFPGTAFENAPDEAINISLKFKTCIYLRSDIPLNLTLSKMDASKSISCMDWSSSFIYNHDKNTYETHEAIDPFCLK